jgi:uncharacterized protein (DUF983 family)
MTDTRDDVRSAVASIGPPSLRTVVARALALRCPRCGTTPLYAGPFTMREACATCGLRYEREQGYFVGAIYLNYAFAVAIAIGTVFVLDWTVGLSLHAQLVVGIALAALVPILGFRWARSLWLGIDYFVTSADERVERRRAARR